MMKPIERLECAIEGRAPDRVPFVPSIYEHGARVIGKSPGETGHDAALMAEAALASYALYQHDLVTVGIDIYNIEAEAFGCRVSDGAHDSIPGIISHPLAAQPSLDARALASPKFGGGNRLALIQEAAGKVAEKIGKEVWVYACMGGVFTQAVELRSFEKLIADIYEAPEAVHALMEKTTELSLRHARALSQRGCGVYLYESWATLPLIDPAIFGEYVIPYNKRIISALRSEFKTPPPSVIMGGKSTLLVDYFVEAGASIMVADYNTDFDFIRDKTRGVNIIIRGCADPKMIERGDWDGVGKTLTRLARMD
ncbi:MAG: hypothetical protein NTX50_27720 [Candidatus Sumerlaeota bacterium]|nr:hypothetical protein [Candidatus Sumerlaeota bacterium]